MKRDAAVPALAALLLVPALSVAGLVTGSLLPRSPAAFYPLALGVALFFFVGVAPVRGRSWMRPLTLALAASPFLVFAVVEGAGTGSGLPATGWFLVLGAAMLLGLAGRRQGSTLAAVLVVALGGGAVLAAADLEIVPQRLSPLDHPVAAAPRAGGTAGSTGATSRAGLALVRLPRATPATLGSGPGPWWRSGSETGAVRMQRPVLLVLGGEASLEPQTEVTVVRSADLRIAHPFDLAAFDAVLVGETAWAEATADAQARAAAIAGFVRAGGLLIGPGVERAWPPKLALRLRGGGRIAENGVPGAKRLGLGHVGQAKGVSDLEDLLEARLWVPEVATVFDRRAGGMPRIPAAFEAWQDRPGGRRVQGALLLAYTLVLAAFAWLVRAPGSLLLTVLLAAAVTAVGVVWTSPQDPGFRLHGFALDLGGPGGRRIEGLVISAGPRGFERTVHWSGDGALALRGARVTDAGAVAVPPGRTGLVLRERTGVGVAEGDREDRTSAFLRSLLVGDVDPRRVRLGRLAALPVRVAGLGAIPAATLLYRSAAP